MKGITLRTKMMLLSVSVTAVVLLIVGIVLTSLFSSSLRRGLDKLLYQDVETIEESLNFRDNGAVELFAPSTHEQNSYERASFQVRALDGRVLLSSFELTDVALPMPHIVPESVRSYMGDIQLGEESYRLFSRVHAKENHTGKEDVLVQVIRPWKPYQAEEQRLRTLMWWLLPFPIALIGLGSWFIAAVTLLPLNRMIATVRNMGAQDLAPLLPVTRNDELGRLAVTFNSLFDRLQKSFQSLRRFTADASHELRTPLTAIRTQAEVALSRARTTSQYRDTIGSMLEEVNRLERLTDTLLQLARGDANIVEAKWETVDLSKAVATWLERLSVIVEEKNIEVVADIQPDISVVGDRCILDRVIVNLIDNAAHYTPTGGHIQVSLKQKGNTITFAVADSGPGIPVAERARIFERFVRLDTTRQQTTGSGLGLAIVKWAIEMHQGSISVESVEPHGSRFIVSLPACSV